VQWEILDEAGVKTIDHAAKKEIDDAVIVAKNSPEPDITKDLWTDVYVRTQHRFERIESNRKRNQTRAKPQTERVLPFLFSLSRRKQYKGTEPPFMRGREREEVHYY